MFDMPVWTMVSQRTCLMPGGGREETGPCEVPRISLCLSFQHPAKRGFFLFKTFYGQISGKNFKQFQSFLLFFGLLCLKIGVSQSVNLYISFILKRKVAFKTCLDSTIYLNTIDF